MSGLIRLVDIPTHGDQRGSLSVAELGGALPFVVRRAYWLHGTQPGVSRGFHSHKKLNQLCVCVKGSVRFVLSAGTSQESVTLNRPDQGLLVGPGLWHEMHDFSADCVLMVLADAEYAESDYIRSRPDGDTA
ncbi:MAG: sugar 3,4-ketoisomerase [Verrucomicrobiota bacterium]